MKYGAREMTPRSTDPEAFEACASHEKIRRTESKTRQPGGSSYRTGKMSISSAVRISRPLDRESPHVEKIVDYVSQVIALNKRDTPGKRLPVKARSLGSLATTLFGYRILAPALAEKYSNFERDYTQTENIVRGLQNDFNDFVDESLAAKQAPLFPRRHTIGFTGMWEDGNAIIGQKNYIFNNECLVFNLHLKKQNAGLIEERETLLRDFLRGEQKLPIKDYEFNNTGDNPNYMLHMTYGHLGWKGYHREGHLNLPLLGSSNMVAPLKRPTLTYHLSEPQLGSVPITDTQEI